MSFLFPTFSFAKEKVDRKKIKSHAQSLLPPQIGGQKENQAPTARFFAAAVASRLPAAPAARYRVNPSG